MADSNLTRINRTMAMIQQFGSLLVCGVLLACLSGCKPSSEKTSEADQDIVSPSTREESTLAEEVDKSTIPVDPVEREKSLELISEPLETLIGKTQTLIELANSTTPESIEDIGRVDREIGVDLQAMKQSLVTLKDREKFPLVMRMDGIERIQFRLSRAVSFKNETDINRYAAELRDSLNDFKSAYSANHLQ